MRTLLRICAAACLGLVGSAGSAAAEERPLGAAPPPAAGVEAPDTYGTTSQTVFLVPSFNFTPGGSTVAYQTSDGAGLGRYITTPGGTMYASAMLPNGARVERIELRACDTSASGGVAINFARCPIPGDSCTLAGSVSTGPAAATPGCGNFGLDLASPFNVDNQNMPLLIQMLTGTTNATTFEAVKIYYRLRVSPSPGVATFPVDTPTSHPFFRFIEALAASGITAGCGPGMYCPDSPITRGEMAVFLAAALGLHFPN